VAARLGNGRSRKIDFIPNADLKEAKALLDQLA
jgi:hypothetical protein